MIIWSNFSAVRASGFLSRIKMNEVDVVAFPDVGRLLRLSEQHLLSLNKLEATKQRLN